MKILGIDYGKKRIGLAISVPGISFAVGYRILEINASGISGLIDNIKEIAVKEQITSVVLGLPKQLDNTVGLAGREVMQFADELHKALNGSIPAGQDTHREPNKNIDIPVILWDERLTSKQAEVLLRDVNMSHKDKRQQVNVTAAQVMLQSYLDAQASKGLHEDPMQDTPDEEKHD
jgi:putative Holliday junction resolvase